jgi:short-subunit dehydrogenase
MNSNMVNFKDKYGSWALIAGASEGIGAAFSEALAQRGLNLILVARRKTRLSELAQDLRSRHEIEVMEHPLDLGSMSSVRDLISSLDKNIGLLVYNAAYSPIGYFKDVPHEDLENIITVNIQTPLFMVKALTHPMIERGKGAVILMSSLSGIQGSPKIATYAASKSFNNVLAEGLWHELRGFNIDVLACVAGAVRTPGYMASANEKDAPGTLDPHEVVEETLAALGSSPTLTPGSFNRLAKFIMSRILPRKRAIRIMHNNTKDLQ